MSIKDFDMEKSFSDVKQTLFSYIPLRALRISTRTQLSQYLNPEQLIPSDDGLARDYRGIAELMGFTDLELKNIQRSQDPMKSLLNAYEVKPKTNHNSESKSATNFEELITMLETIGRFDILDDLLPSFKKDASIYQNNQSSNPHSKILNYCNKSPLTSPFPSLDMNHLTIDDTLSTNGSMYYDAYVCYADEDGEFVQFLSEFLEGRIGLKLFIPGRDLLVGHMQHDAIFQMIEERCNRMLIILTPEFCQSSECEFQTRFATGLAIEQRNRKIIPIIYKRCDLPPVVRFMSKIDLSKGDQTPDWTWKKLVVSIKSSYSENFIPSPHTHSIDKLNDSASSINSNILALPVILNTPTAPMISTESITTDTDKPIITEISSSTVINNYTPPTTPSTTRDAKPNKRSWMKNFFKQKISVSTTGGSVSPQSSGYQSLKDA